MGKRVAKHLTYLFEALLEVVYYKDDVCIICGGNAEEINICKSCLNKIKTCPGDTVLCKNNNYFIYYSVSYYSKVMKTLILRLKYKGDFFSGETIAKLMVSHIQREKIKFDAITFVPMTKRAEKKRGYNQSQFLSKLVSKSLDVPLIKCLVKVHESNDQIGLDGSGRWDNLSNCFRAVNEKMYLGKVILLIDDVITTGATAYYCGDAMKKSGAKSVIVLTAAKSCI